LEPAHGWHSQVGIEVLGIVALLQLCCITKDARSKIVGKWLLQCSARVAMAPVL